MKEEKFTEKTTEKICSGGGNGCYSRSSRKQEIEK